MAVAKANSVIGGSLPGHVLGLNQRLTPMNAVCPAANSSRSLPSPLTRLKSVPLRLLIDTLHKCIRQTNAKVPQSNERLAESVSLREFASNNFEKYWGEKIASVMMTCISRQYAAAIPNL